MKLICTLMIFGLLVILSANTVMADKQHHKIIKINHVINNYTAACDPVANAGNEIHHSNGTDDLQIGAGFAICDDGTEGGKISLGQRFCPLCPLLNISAGKQEGEKTVWGFGFNWKVKIK